MCLINLLIKTRTPTAKNKFSESFQNYIYCIIIYDDDRQDDEICLKNWRGEEKEIKINVSSSD